MLNTQLVIVIVIAVIFYICLSTKESWGTSPGTLIQLASSSTEYPYNTYPYYTASSGYFPYYSYGFGYRYPYYRYPYYRYKDPYYLANYPNGYYPLTYGNYNYGM